MGALELENGGVIVPCCFDDDEEEVEEYGSGSQGSVEEAVEVLLRGLGEDIRREGIKKTPFRVAKAFRDGTKGSFFFYFKMTFLDFRFRLFFLLDLF